VSVGVLNSTHLLAHQFCAKHTACQENHYYCPQLKLELFSATKQHLLLLLYAATDKIQYKTFDFDLLPFGDLLVGVLVTSSDDITTEI